MDTLIVLRGLLNPRNGLDLTIQAEQTTNERRALAAIIVLAAVLRFVALGSQLLWYDEIYTARLVRRSLARMTTVTAGDVHPPLYYVLPWITTRLFGESEWSLRLPSAILGVLAVWLAWRLARSALGSPNAALIAAGLLAVSPFGVYYSNEARMYALLICAITLGMVGAVERRGWLLALGTCIALCSHNMAVIYLPGLGLTGWRRGGFKWAAAWIGLGMLPWLAWLPAVFSQFSTLDTEGYWIRYFTGNLATTLLYNISDVLFLHFALYDASMQFVVTTSALIVFPLIALVRRRDRGAADLALAAFCPPVTLLILSATWQSLILMRVLAGMLVPWLALIAWFVTLPRRVNAPRVALAGMALLFFLACTGTYYANGRYPVTYYRLAWLRENLQESDYLCHGDAIIEYYTGIRGGYDLERCTLLWWLEYPTIPPDIQTAMNEAATHGVAVYKDPYEKMLFPVTIYRMKPDG